MATDDVASQVKRAATFWNEWRDVRGDIAQDLRQHPGDDPAARERAAREMVRGMRQEADRWRQAKGRRGADYGEAQATPIVERTFLIAHPRMEQALDAALESGADPWDAVCKVYLETPLTAQAEAVGHVMERAPSDPARQVLLAGRVRVGLNLSKNQQLRTALDTSGERERTLLDLLPTATLDAWHDPKRRTLNDLINGAARRMEGDQPPALPHMVNSDLPTQRTNPEQAFLLQNRMREEVEECSQIAGLSRHEQQVFTLRVAGLTHKEIAVRLGNAEGTVKATWSHARRKLDGARPQIVAALKAR